ncbi:MAG: noncanonical pyrimidine nucleotidase, YjjG family [Clostridiales bacterium]|nr:noncanonical pyrimidine nucleotidase, YjjG family [Clostridiales bacterium]
MIKYVFIDIDDTLLDFDKNASLAVEMAFSKVGLNYKQEYGPWFLKINDGLWKMIERKELTREQLHKIRFKKVLSEFSLVGDGELVEKLFREYLFNLAIPVDGALDIVKYLSKKYTLFVASNAIYLQQINRLRKAGLLEYFNKIFVSENIGHNKPSKEFFDACFAEIDGATPQNTIMIGDSLTADIKGANDYGMKTIWFNKKKAPLPEEHIYTYMVTDLEEVKNYL